MTSAEHAKRPSATKGGKQDRERTGPKPKLAKRARRNVNENKGASATKSGPGRYHSSGATKASPIKSKGAPRGFVLHHASEEKRQRRAAIKQFGRRQLIRIHAN